MQLFEWCKFFHEKIADKLDYMTKTRSKVDWRDFHSYIEFEAHISGPHFETASASSALYSREYKYRANNFLETTLIWSFVFV